MRLKSRVGRDIFASSWIRTFRDSPYPMPETSSSKTGVQRLKESVVLLAFTKSDDLFPARIPRFDPRYVRGAVILA